MGPLNPCNGLGFRLEGFGPDGLSALVPQFGTSGFLNFLAGRSPQQLRKRVLG